MARLLQRAQVKGIAPKFTRQLLAAFQERVKPGMVLKDELYVEPLSERELEVLHRLNSHLSVPEIAGELYVSANTVRTHIKNIYGKLGVHRRSLAVLRGRELGLLD
jgi:LuxR family transcriptional regulator, maltose regulon positive regulatory protein